MMRPARRIGTQSDRAPDMPDIYTQRDSDPPIIIWGDSAHTAVAGGPGCCIPRCLDGKDLYLTMQGITNGLCAGCVDLNDTFIVGTISGYSCCAVLNKYYAGSGGCSDWVVTNPGAVDFAAEHFFSPVPTWSLRVRVKMHNADFENQTIEWRKEGSEAFDLIKSLCNGDQIELPFYAHYDHEGTTDGCGGGITRSDNTSSRQCISDHSPLLLQAL